MLMHYGNFMYIHLTFFKGFPSNLLYFYMNFFPCNICSKKCAVDFFPIIFDPLTFFTQFLRKNFDKTILLSLFKSLQLYTLLLIRLFFI
ncbi:unnamed protein product [Blepharisma stoltei]|uniref:Uncharacterized protein n=1 Tax=Blepharisma stoltei TaxID=1481888 RepID=A0AAU9KCH0_9CILI|nr:unnamed protein product [Blepharisma stoltei]